jgi:hypothetical protein
VKDKLSVKSHIRLTEDLFREVRATAELENRPIQDQLRVFVLIGLQVFKSRGNGNPVLNGRTMPHDAANATLPAPPIAAKSRTAPHRRIA